MGAFTNLIEQLPGIITRRVDRALWDWMWAISQLADNISGGTQAQTRYVDKGGNDATGDGSFDNPFLTIQAAITSITDATATKQYTIHVGPGIYATAFALQPWIFIEGENREATVLANPSANWIGAGFAAAGTQTAGISNVTLGANFLVDFAAVASPGAGTFILTQINYAATAISATGNNSTNLFSMADVFNTSLAFPATACAFANLAVSLAHWVARAVPLTLSNAAAYAVTMVLSDVAITNTIAISCASTVNTLSVLTYNGALAGTASDASFVLTGDGVTVRGLDIVRTAALADANQTIDFNTFTAGAVKAINAGENLFTIAPTAERTLTINTPSARGTRLRIKNTTQFACPLTFVGTSTGGLSYIPAFGYFEAFYATNWNVFNDVQSGKVTLTNGVSALIPADITAQSAIVATLNDINGSATTGPVWVAKPADRVVGTRAGGGGFKITGTTNAGATNAADNGIYDYVVTRP